MNHLFTNHRLNRCKTVQVKLPDVSRSLGDTIQVQLFGADKPSRKTFQVQFLDFDKLPRKFPFVAPHVLELADAEVRIVTKSDITKLRRKGYVVEVVQKLPNLYPNRLVDVLSPTIKPIGIQNFSPIIHDAPNAITDIGCPSVCCTNNGNPKRNGSLHQTIGNGRRTRALGVTTPKNRTQQLLERYIVLIRKQEYIAKEQAEVAKEMDEIRAELVAILPESNDGIVEFNIFQPFVDESKLSDCFHCIFQKFFGVLPTERLEGEYNEQIDLIAYFFILVEWEKLGNYIFTEKCKKPFFEYINKNVLTEELDVTERTFHNRLTRTMDDFRKKLSKEPFSSKFKGECWKRDCFIKDFLKVLGIFHGTDYYKELELRKHA